MPSFRTSIQRRPPRVNSAFDGNPRNRRHALTKRCPHLAMKIFCRVLSKFTSSSAASGHARPRVAEVGLVPVHVRGVRAQADRNAIEI
jgi:hypothetical protein